MFSLGSSLYATFGDRDSWEDLKLRYLGLSPLRCTRQPFVASGLARKRCMAPHCRLGDSLLPFAILTPLLMQHTTLHYIPLLLPHPPMPYPENSEGGIDYKLFCPLLCKTQKVSSFKGPGYLLESRVRATTEESKPKLISNDSAVDGLMKAYFTWVWVMWEWDYWKWFDFERKPVFSEAFVLAMPDVHLHFLPFLTKKLPFESQNVSTEVIFNRREMFESQPLLA